MKVGGILLAAGPGTRMGQPKALIEDVDGTPWVVSSARALADGGCSVVVVVVGAQSGRVRALLASTDHVIVEAPDWRDGMSASLKRGLEALAETDVQAAAVHLVDIPDVGPDVVMRVLSRASPVALGRADFGRGHGHPVLMGRDHWPGVRAQLGGDRGAQDYLDGHVVELIDCSSLATGRDVDEMAPGDRAALDT